MDSKNGSYEFKFPVMGSKGGVCGVKLGTMLVQLIVVHSRIDEVCYHVDPRGEFSGNEVWDRVESLDHAVQAICPHYDQGAKLAKLSSVANEISAELAVAERYLANEWDLRDLFYISPDC